MNEWAELFALPQQVFTNPRVDFAILLASLFTSTDGPESLLTRVEALMHCSLIILALILDEEPNQITLLKNPHCYGGSLVNPSPVDNLIYSFTGADAWNLAAVHLLASAFKISAQYNVLDVLAMMPGMTNSACQCAIVLPTEWYQELTEHFPHGIDLKVFYNHFLATVAARQCQTLEGVFTWWRHAASRTASTAAPCLGLQVITQQALSPMTHLTHDAWAHMEVDRIL